MYQRGVLSLMLVLALVVCASARGPLAEDVLPTVATTHSTPEFRLGTADVVKARVWKNLDRSVTVPNRSDGFNSQADQSKRN